MCKALKNRIRIVPDFPKVGIQYQDITTLLNDSAALEELNAHWLQRYQSYNN